MKVPAIVVRQTFIVCASATLFMVGIGLARIMPLYAAWWLLLCAPPLFILRKKKGIVLLFLFCVVSFGGGLLRGSEFAQRYALYDEFDGQKVVLVGRADSDAVYGSRSQLTFTLRHTSVVSPGQYKLVGTQEISGFGEPMVYKGQWVQVEGKLKKARGNNSARLSFAELMVVGGKPTWIDTVRREFAAGIQSALPEPAASFGMGILVGQRNTLPDDVAEHLKAVGLTHIIAVSGYNLTIIMRGSKKLFGNRSKYQYTLLSAVLIGLFLLVAGGSPSIVRASVVCALSLAAWYYGRTVTPMVLLLVSGAITAWLNPLYVWGNVSWYLSFLAFFGVLVIAPTVIKRFFSKKEPGLIKAVVIESLCAEVATLPYVLWVFGEFSLVGIVGNTLVVAFIPLAMLLTLFAGLAGVLIPFLVGWIAWPATLLLTYMLDVAHVLSKAPYAFMDGLQFSTAMMITSYVIICSILLVMHYKSRQKYAIITDRKEGSLEGV